MEETVVMLSLCVYIVRPHADAHTPVVAELCNTSTWDRIDGVAWFQNSTVGGFNLKTFYYDTTHK